MPPRAPRLLIVAPMSGHYATLLRGTVERMLPTHDVYITDWKDARDVPLTGGGFDLESYIDYLVEWLEFIGPDAGGRGRRPARPRNPGLTPAASVQPIANGRGFVQYRGEPRKTAASAHSNHEERVVDPLCVSPEHLDKHLFSARCIASLSKTSPCSCDALHYTPCPGPRRVYFHSFS